MEKRLILFDVIPWFVGWPLSPAWTALLLVVCLRKYDGQDGFYVHFDGLEGHPPHFTPEPAEPRLFVEELGPPPRARTTISLVTRTRKFDGLDESYAGDGAEGRPPFRALGAPTLEDNFDDVRDAIETFLAELHGPEMSWGRETGFGFRFRVSECCDEVEQTLGGVGDAEDVIEEFQAGYDEMAFGNILGFGGYETRDWGYLAWESERGPDEFMTMKRS